MSNGGSSQRSRRRDPEDPASNSSCFVGMQGKLEDPDIIAREVEKERRGWTEAERSNRQIDIFQVFFAAPRVFRKQHSLEINLCSELFCASEHIYMTGDECVTIKSEMVCHGWLRRHCKPIEEAALPKRPL
jgi:hypothetical protein